MDIIYPHAYSRTWLQRLEDGPDLENFGGEIMNFGEILMEKCQQSASDSAKSICDLSRQKGVDQITLINHFQELLPKVNFDPVSSWEETEKVIAKACFIMEMQVITRHYEPAS